MNRLTIIFAAKSRNMIISIDSASALKDIVLKNENLLVYFFSNECAPCKSLRPKVEDLITKRFPLMDLVYVDAQQFPEMIAEYQAYSYPVLLFFFEGKEYLRYSKYVSLSELNDSIGRIYDLYHSPK